MARGKKVVYKKAAGRKKKTYVEESDDDESYVAEDESTSESDAHNEESFDASETSDSASLVAGEDEDEDDDDEEEEEDEEEVIPTAKQKLHRGYCSGRRRTRVSDCDWEEDDYEDDEDFSPDANEKEVLEEDSLLLGDIRYSSRRATKKGERKLKRKTLKPKVNRRSSKVTVAPSRGKRRRVVTSSGDEDNFVVKNRSAVKNCRKDSRKLNKRAVKSIASRKKVPSIDSDSFDSDFLTSDDDLSVKVGVVVNGTKNKKRTKSEKRRKVLKMDSETSDSDFVVSDEGLLDDDIVGLGRRRKNRNERKSVRTSKKHISVESDTDSNDSVSEDDMKGLEIERTLNLRKHKGSEGVKGKEKEGGDLVKQSCGICLSEERKGTIQGILNCCPHYYCFSCIIEWSKVETRCPFCKRRFATITKSSKSDPRRSVIRVQMRDQVYQPSEEELRVLLDPYEDVVCMECHQGGDDSLMLLCDICDSSAHTYCVGLGSEVPDGNWYCECCRLAADGGAAGPSGSSSNRTTQSQGAEGNGPIFRWSVPSQGQPSSQPFDLNAPPDVVPASPASGTGALTLSGRRAIQQRIRILLSNSRARQPLVVGVGPSIVTTSSQRTNAASPFEQEQVQSSGGDFRQVEGAKKQVQSLVKSCLKRLCRESSLERTAFKKIARKATHTILALCGIHHRTSFISPSCLQPPARCHHDLDSGPVNLVRGCCSSCFTDYVKHVVKYLAEAF